MVSIMCSTRAMAGDMTNIFMYDIYRSLPKIIKQVSDAEGKCAIIWMLGSFGEYLDRGPYLIEKYVRDYSNESSTIVKLVRHYV